MFSDDAFMDGRVEVDGVAELLLDEGVVLLHAAKLTTAALTAVMAISFQRFISAIPFLLDA